MALKKDMIQATKHTLRENRTEHNGPIMFDAGKYRHVAAPHLLGYTPFQNSRQQPGRTRRLPPAPQWTGPCGVFYPWDMRVRLPATFRPVGIQEFSNLGNHGHQHMQILKTKINQTNNQILSTK